MVYKQLEQRGMAQPPVNVSTLRSMKADGEPIACLTAYDASLASIVDQAGTDVVLVGDSLGMVIQGHDTTVPVTVADIIYHTRGVARGLRRAFLMADMPFMSYTTPVQALDNAVRLMQEGGAMMVKLECGAGQVRIVENLAQHDIPVCAHLGLKAQSVHKIGGFRVQGREQAQARQMVEDALALEKAGADIVLLECVPNEVGRIGTRCREGAGDRHRRGSGRRRPDPGAVRHARHHPGTPAAVRAEFHGKRPVGGRRLRGLRAAPSRSALTRLLNTAFPERLAGFSCESGRREDSARHRWNPARRRRLEAGAAAGRPRADHGQSARRPYEPDDACAASWRSRRGEHFRQSDPVRSQ